MRNKAISGWLILVCLLSGPLWAQQTRVKAFELTTTAKRTRLSLQLSAAGKHHVFVLAEPDRLVIDLAEGSLETTIAQPPPSHRLIHRIRNFVRDDKSLRIVVDLKAAVKQQNALEAPAGSGGRCLVIDLTAKPPAAAAKNGGASNPRRESIAAAEKSVQSALKRVTQAVPEKQPVASERAAPSKGKNPRIKRRAVSRQPQKIVVAIDAGHGGRDTGAIGPGGTREKDVVLAIARRLAGFIRAEPDMRAILTRRGDDFISLRQRIQQAQKVAADLFVSIHADADPDDSAHGSSVFTRSSDIHSGPLPWLASRESVTGLQDLPKDTLLTSHSIARSVLRELKKSHDLHYSQVQRAGYLVLRCPDIPSVLVETAFISNTEEEKRLRSARHQRRIARSIFYGIRGHFGRRTPQPLPAGVRIAAKRHVIAPGEQLGAIAQRYGVSVERLMTHNDLANDQIHAGETLQIPGDG